MPYKQYSDQEMVNLRATIMLSYGMNSFQIFQLRNFYKNSVKIVL